MKIDDSIVDKVAGLSKLEFKKERFDKSTSSLTVIKAF